MTPLLRELLGERYRLGPPLGHGAFGDVLRVYDRRDDAWRALKSSADIERLGREAEALASIHHPAVVRVHDWGAVADCAYLTMDLVAGMNPLEALRADLPPPEAAGLRRNLPMAFGYAMQDEGTSAYRRCSAAGLEQLQHLGRVLSEGLQAIHEAGYLHLDVQPNNVRLAQGGAAVLLDLGLALRRDQPMPGEALAGMPGYLAPELALGRPGPASDTYSLGVLLFEILTGQLPFEGGGVEVMVRKQTIEAPRAKELVSGVPERFDRLLGDMLARDPRSRPSLAAVFDALGPN